MNLFIHKANFVHHKCNKNIHIKYQMVYTKQWKIFTNGIFLNYRFFKVYFSSNPMSRLSDFTRTYKV